MYGDTAAMRKRAAQLREQGTDVRALADRLVASVEALAWTGRAANDMRARVQDRANHLRDCASDGLRPWRWAGRFINKPGWSPDGHHSRSPENDCRDPTPLFKRGLLHV